MKGEKFLFGDEVLNGLTNPDGGLTIDQVREQIGDTLFDRFGRSLIDDRPNLGESFHISGHPHYTWYIFANCGRTGRPKTHQLSVTLKPSQPNLREAGYVSITVYVGKITACYDKLIFRECTLKRIEDILMMLLDTVGTSSDAYSKLEIGLLGDTEWLDPIGEIRKSSIEVPITVRVFYDLKDSKGIVHEDTKLSTIEFSELELRWVHGFKFYISLTYIEDSVDSIGKVCVRFENDMSFPPDVPAIAFDKKLKKADASSSYDYSVDISDELEVVAGLWSNYRQLRHERELNDESRQDFEANTKLQVEEVGA